MKTFHILLLSFLFFAFSACKPHQEKDLQEGSVELSLIHLVGQQPLEKNEFVYTNKAGNTYMISEIQWFMSDIVFTMEDGRQIRPDSLQQFLYVDTDIPSTNRQSFLRLPAGHYRKIGFTFGLDEAHNTSNRFVNPPESYMFWPEYLGGGYHYMKLNGKWIDPGGLQVPFNFHLGIGQISAGNRSSSDNIFRFGLSSAYSHCEGFSPPYLLPEVTEFIQNYFEISQDIDFEILPEMSTQIRLEMLVDQWFDAVKSYDHNDWGGSIMQQQGAQEVARENGQSAFVFRLQSN